jgi:hypothetical protein
LGDLTASSATADLASRETGTHKSLHDSQVEIHLEGKEIHGRKLRKCFDFDMVYQIKLPPQNVNFGRRKRCISFAA